MDIVIVANFTRDFSDSDNGRFRYLASMLSAVGHEVEIVTSDFSHGKKKHKEPLKHGWPFHVTFLHEPGYQHNVSLSRLVSHRAWGCEVGRYLDERRRPDVVYCAMPSLTAAALAARYCERNGVRFVIDVQDLWPEAFELALDVPVVSDVAFAPMARLANFAYSRADAVCAVSKTYAERAMRVNRKCAEATVVYLGTELETFDRYAAENKVERNDEEVWLGYCGTLGASYDLTVAIEAIAVALEAGSVPLRLVAMGDGERRAEFETLATNLGVDATFTGRLPYPEMCGMLVSCDIAVNPIRKGAAQSIINKHADYASAGIPVISTQESSEYRELVAAYGMGINCESGNSTDLAGALMLLSSDAELRASMGSAARRCAEERFDRARTYGELVECIFG